MNEICDLLKSRESARDTVFAYFTDFVALLGTRSLESCNKIQRDNSCGKSYTYELKITSHNKTIYHANKIQ